MTEITAPMLAGKWVRLEPLAEEHREGLRIAADDERIWEHMLGIARGPEFDVWFENSIEESAAGKRVAFAVRRLHDAALVGHTAYLDPVPTHRRVEIGSTWYRPDVWQTAVNPGCKLLLLSHAFDTLQLNRVSLVTDLRNARSQAAIAKLGAIREGVLRAHMITRDSRVRDSVIFGITRAEWPAVKERLLARLISR